MYSLESVDSLESFQFAQPRLYNQSLKLKGRSVGAVSDRRRTVPSFRSTLTTSSV